MCGVKRLVVASDLPDYLLKSTPDGKVPFVDWGQKNLSLVRTCHNKQLVAISFILHSLSSSERRPDY